MTTKEEQKKLLTEIMEADSKDGLYKQMTPKEKAYDLVILFTDKHNNVRKDLAKKFALLAVGIVLDYSKAHGFVGLTEYYLEVKQEIEEL